MKITIQFDSLEEFMQYDPAGTAIKTNEIKNNGITTIEELFPSSRGGMARVRNLLFGQGIYTVDKLISYSEIDFLKMPSIGRGSLATIKLELAKYGLKLKD